MRDDNYIMRIYKNSLRFPWFFPKHREWHRFLREHRVEINYWNRNRNWIERDYVGKTILISGEEIIATDESAVGVFYKVDQLEGKAFLIKEIPRPGEEYKPIELGSSLEFLK